MSRRATTVQIKTKQGMVDYAKVAARLAEMHADTRQASVESSVEIITGNNVWALCKAKVTTPRGVFNGHSITKIDDFKALEKAETIAVGRALAFAGYLASGEIASFEEMADYAQESVGGNAFVEAFRKKIAQSESRGELSDLRSQLTTMVSNDIIEAGVGARLVDEIYERLSQVEPEEAAK